MLKKCSKCGKEKAVTDFYKCKDGRYGVRGSCKDCCNEAHKEYKQKNAAQVSQKQREWREKNREHLVAQKQKYYQKNKDHVLKKCSKYYKQNREAKLKQFREYRKQNAKRISVLNKAYRQKNANAIKEAQKQYRKNNKQSLREYSWRNREKKQQYNLQYRKLNKEKISQYNTGYSRERAKTDMCYRITKNLRGRAYKALKGESKSASTLSLLGCSPEQLKQYMKNQFDDKMSWENYGIDGWHIDHIVPCAAFDLTDPEQQKLCFHYTNLQPLWAEENLKKADKILALQ